MKTGQNVPNRTVTLQVVKKDGCRWVRTQHEMMEMCHVRVMHKCTSTMHENSCVS